MPIPEENNKKWALGDVVDATINSATNLTHDLIVPTVLKDGETQEPAIIVPAARVAAPVDPDTHGGASGISCDAFFAEFIVSEQKAYILDDIGARHPGIRAFEVGNNLILPRQITEDSYVLIVRTAEFGTAGIDKNVVMAAIPRTGPLTLELVAHHLLNNPNVNSTLVSDPDGAGRKGPIDDQWRVRNYNPQNGTVVDQVGQSFPPQSFSPGGDDMAVMLNYTLSGVGQNRGYGLTHFAISEARMSHEASGALRPSSSKHKEARTQEADINAGALDVNAYFTNGSPDFDAPLDIELVEEPDVQDPPGIPIRVHLQHDKESIHDFILGLREGKFRWHVRSPLVKTPPCKDESSSAAVVRNSDGREAAMATSPTATSVYMIEPFTNLGWDAMPMPGIHKLAR